MDPESPFNPIPPYISAVLRGEQPQPLHADYGGDCCYAPDAGRAIALLMTADNLRHDTYNVSSGRPFPTASSQTPYARSSPAGSSTCGPDDRPARPRPLPRHHPPHQDTGFAPAFDVAAAVAHYVAWRADNPR